jgi:N utilization substance protein B
MTDDTQQIIPPSPGKGELAPPRPVPTHFKRLGREFAMQYLYQAEMTGENSPGARAMFWDQAAHSESFPDKGRIFRKAREYADALIDGVTAGSAELDAVIAKFSEKWAIERIAVIDKNIMRVAVFEMTRGEDVPPIVSINEAVEIAKDFGSDKSGNFINGVLNGIKNTLSRDPRKAARPKNADNAAKTE